MKIVTSRDIKNNPNILFDEPSETVITSRGRPRAICITLDDDELENLDDFIGSIHQARAKRIFEKVRGLLLERSELSIKQPERIQEIVSSAIHDQGKLF